MLCWLLLIYLRLPLLSCSFCYLLRAVACALPDWYPLPIRLVSATYPLGIRLVSAICLVLPWYALLRCFVRPVRFEHLVLPPYALTACRACCCPIRALMVHGWRLSVLEALSLVFPNALLCSVRGIAAAVDTLSWLLVGHWLWYWLATSISDYSKAGIP